MTHKSELSQAALHADQLCVLLLLLERTHDQLSDTDLATALGLARDLSGLPSTWLLDEQRRESAEVSHA